MMITIFPLWFAAPPSSARTATGTVVGKFSPSFLNVPAIVRPAPSWLEDNDTGALRRARCLTPGNRQLKRASEWSRYAVPKGTNPSPAGRAHRAGLSMDLRPEDPGPMRLGRGRLKIGGGPALDCAPLIQALAREAPCKRRLLRRPLASKEMPRGGEISGRSQWSRAQSPLVTVADVASPIVFQPPAAKCYGQGCAARLERDAPPPHPTRCACSRHHIKP